MEKYIVDTKRLCWLQNNLGLTDEMLDDLIERGSYLKETPDYWRRKVLSSLEAPKTIIELYLKYIDLEELTKIYSTNLMEGSFSSVEEVKLELEKAKVNPLHNFNKMSYYETKEKLIESLIKYLLNEMDNLSRISEITGYSRKQIRDIKNEVAK